MWDAVVHFYPDKMMTINQTALCPDKKRILEKQLLFKYYTLSFS